MARKMAQKKLNPYKDYPGVCSKWPAVPGVGNDMPSQSRSPKPGDDYAGNSLPLDNPLRFDSTASRTPNDFITGSDAMKMAGKSKFGPREAILPVRPGDVSGGCAGAEQESLRLRHVIDRDPFDNPIPDAEDIL